MINLEAQHAGAEAVMRPRRLLLWLGAAATSLALVQPAGAASGYEINNCGNTTDKVMLSYDDWNYANPEGAIMLAKKLRRNKIGAFFFPLGKYNHEYYAKTGVNVAKEVRRYGQYEGNHSYSHPNLTSLSTAQLRSQIERGIDSHHLRPPGGAYNEEVIRIAKDMGYRICTWDVDTRDWEGKTAAQICNYAVGNAHKGAMILMHLQTKAPQALDCIIEGVKDKGLEFCEPWRNKTGQIATSPKELPYIIPCAPEYWAPA